MRDDLYEVDVVPFKGKKMLIPRKLRGIVLEGLHAAHQRTTSMRVNALIITTRPEYPFEQAVIDLCFLEGHDFPREC